MSREGFRIEDAAVVAIGGCPDKGAHPDGCSRIRSGQSLQEPQVSIGRRSATATYSIETTYLHSITTDFHKRPDLLWEQRVVSSNLTAPTNVFSALPLIG